MAVEILKPSIKSEYTVNGLGPNKVNVLIGGKDETVGNKFVPNVNFSYECFSEDILRQEYFYINLNRKDIAVTNQKETFIKDKLEISIGEENHIYRVDDKGFQWDIRFNSRPLVNSWDWDLQFSKELIFARQNTLEEDFYSIGGEGYETLNEFLENAHRPERVVDSYTIYCPKRNWYKDWEGRTRANFKGGKLEHIFAPYFIDSIGRKKKSDLFIDPENHLLRVSCDPDWLNTAIYPVTLDPDFGHDVGDLGDSQIQSSNNQRGVIGTSAGAGTGDNCYIVMGGTDSGTAVKMHLYTPASNGTPIVNGDTEERTGALATEEWLPFAFNSAPTIEAATTYLVLGWANGQAANYIKYDSSNNVTRFYDTETYNGWNDPLSGTYGDSSYNYCTYCSYTETGGLLIPVRRRRM